jgi:hypothetical protein
MTDLIPMGLFTVDQARIELAKLRPVIDELIVVRADLVEISAALTPGGLPTTLGGLPELMTAIQETGAELKGVAPLLVDFPADLVLGDLGEVPVLLCWLEGDAELTWYHRADLGFAGRRPLGDRTGA